MSDRDELARALNSSIGGMLDLDMTVSDGVHVLRVAADAVLASGWLAAHDERVRTEEREKCLKVAEAESGLHVLYLDHVTSDTRWEQGAIGASDRIAAAIRAVSAEQEDHHG